MFAMGEATFAMPQDELDKFEQGDSGMSAGYKRAGSNNVDAAGNLDTAHFINVAKDDALAYPEVKHRTYPSATTERVCPALATPRTCADSSEQFGTITTFVRKADDVLQGLMTVLEPRLGLEKGTLAKLHAEGDISGSETRCILKPAPGERGYLKEGVGEDGNPAAAIGSHTDFGSFRCVACVLATVNARLTSRWAACSMAVARVACRCSRLAPKSGSTSSLSRAAPSATSATHCVRPRPCRNATRLTATTTAVYTGGLLRSNIHRVVPPPGEQAKYDRWSLVYFLRPGFDNELVPLDSDIIRKAASGHPTISKMEHGITAGQWYKRRIAGQRAANRKGPESWAQSRGTERELAWCRCLRRETDASAQTIHPRTSRSVHVAIDLP